MFQKHFLARLKEFGLNSYESKLWVALLSRGVSTAGELSDIANVPRSRSYDVLESLEKKGFIIMKIGKPIKYIAVPPEEVVERVKKIIQENAEASSKVLDELRTSDVLDELKNLHTQGIDLVEPTDLSGCLKGRSAYFNHMSMLIKQAKKSIVLATTAKGIERKKDFLLSSLKKAKTKGVKIQIITNQSAETKEISAKLKGTADIKFVDNMNSRFLVIDGRETIFAINDEKEVHPTYDSAIWVNSSLLSATLQDYFDKVWDKH